MPINQLEQHPYLNYRDNLNVKRDDYTGLIIGSFPIFACSNLLDENLNVLIENNFENQLRFRFFYGSNNSEFWDYMFKVYENENQINIENCINLLENNKLLISDIIFQTNRLNESAADSHLMIDNNVNNFISENLLLNDGILNIIEKNKNIKNLFFTAKGLTGKCPFGWFRSMFENNLEIVNINDQNNRFNCIINGREFNVFLLPTPKPRGIHFTDNQRNVEFSNYMQSIDIEFFNIIDGLPEAERNNQQRNYISQLRLNFIVECYKQAFVHNNLNFNGFILNA